MNVEKLAIKLTEACNKSNCPFPNRLVCAVSWECKRVTSEMWKSRLKNKPIEYIAKRWAISSKIKI